MDGTLKSAMVARYPWTARAGVNVIDSRAQGDPQGYRQLEYYHQGQQDSPTPAMPTVQVFGKNVGPQDVMGDVLSHKLAVEDPWVGNFRQRVLGSMTPDQIQSIHGDYDRDLKTPGATGDNGSTFQGWLNTIGGDSFFRGYPTGQWSPNDYNDTQKRIYQQMDDYLNKRMGR